MKLPTKPFLADILVRATWVWLFLHALGASAAAAVGDAPAGTLVGLGSVWIWGVTAVVVLISMRGRGESLLLANLGFSRRGVVGLVVGWCVLLDVAVVAAVGLLS